MTLRFAMRKPDDWHVHVRQGEPAEQYIKFTAEQFGRATIMPNTKPPIRTVLEASEYRARLMQALDQYPELPGDFEPMMTLYLTDETTTKEIGLAAGAPWMIGAKLYPAGATTNSADGMTDLYDGHARKIFMALEDSGLPLLVHAEMSSGDVFDRERLFLQRHMAGIMDKYPNLRVVIEHITTEAAVHWVQQQVLSLRKVAATITAHHLLVDRNDMLADGLRPHLYCKPILKRSGDRESLVRAATSGETCFFAGTDSAPHPMHAKHNDCCAAGCFTAPHALELYAEAFEQAGSMKNLEKFLSVNGANFFGLPLNDGTVELVENEHTVNDEPDWIKDEEHGRWQGFRIKRFWAGKKLHWKLKNVRSE